MRISLILLPALLGVIRSAPARAQSADSARVAIQKPPQLPAPRKRSTVRDSLDAPLSPGRAFLYSLAIPGLGQSQLNRGTSGAVYVTFEALSIAMEVKSLNDLRIARNHRHDAIIGSYQTSANGQPVLDTLGLPVPLDTLRNRYLGRRVKARQTHVEDWAAALIFNHLFSGADAYVSSQLWDLPARIGFRVAPGFFLARALSRYGRGA